MLGIFEQTTTDRDLYPARDPDVIRLQAVLGEAREALAPAAQAWKDYCAARADDNRSVPFSRVKQHLFDQFTDASWAVEDAEAALRPVVDAAMARATAAWDDRIRQAFLDDLPAIESFIELLRRHEETVMLAQAAGVTHSLNAPMVFLTSQEVATRLQYARTQLGLT
jgi:hypothetical protein